MTRFQQFLFLVQTAVIIENAGGITAIEQLSQIFNPGVEKTISSSSMPVSDFALEYINYVTGSQVRPYWLTFGKSNNPD